MKRLLSLSVFFLFVAGCNLSDDAPLVDPNANNGDVECDECGVCDADPTNDCEQDCAGDWGGEAYEDECGVCDADPTNDCEQDCAGDWGGEAYEDECGVCDADPTNDCEQDCAGDWGGEAYEDECGVCDADPTNDCEQDCAGEWGGEAYEDGCGVCDADPTNDCEQDCAGDWGGEAVIDACNRCVGGSTSRVACPTEVLTVVEDAHVVAPQEDTNFGAEEELLVDRTRSETLLKFDLSSLPNDIVIRSLTLRATVKESEAFGGNGDVNVFFSSDDEWSESSVVFKDKPSFSDFILASWNVAGAAEGQDTVYEVVDSPELLEAFQGQAWGDRVVTLFLSSPGYRSTYYSKESPDADKHFTIEVAYQTLAKIDVPVVADAYVDQGRPDTNFGSAEVLRIDPRPSTAPEETYLKFDLSTIPSNVTIERVALQVLAYNGFAYGGNGNVYTYLVDDDSWDESTLTYDNRPTHQTDRLGAWWLWYDGTAIDKWGINASDLLVAPVVDAYNDDKLISFRLASPGYRTFYRSREYEESTQHPKLTVYITAD